MPLNLVPVIVVRTQRTHVGGGDYADAEVSVPGSPFLARVYRTAQKSFLPDESASGTATVDEQQRLSIMDPACPVQVGDIAFLPRPGGAFTRAKVVRPRYYSDRVQFDLETGADGAAPPPAPNVPPAGRDIGENSTPDAADTGTLTTPSNSMATRNVFAHYMVCNRNYGGTVAGYVRDIQDAQWMGVDGFALNCGSWDSAHYKEDTESIFQAAEHVAAAQLVSANPQPPFKLFFSCDMSGLSYPEIMEMVPAYVGRPNYYHKPVTDAGGNTTLRPYLSTWGGEGGDDNGPTTASVKTRWNSLVINPLKALGIDVFFVPCFFVGYTQDDLVNLFENFVDGAFIPRSATPLPDTTTQSIAEAERRVALLKSAGLYTLGSVSPQYWFSEVPQAGRGYADYSGGLGHYLQWASIILVQRCDDVELFTWNDFGEFTWFSPIDDVNKYWPYIPVSSQLGFFKQRVALANETKYFIQCFKAGAFLPVLDDTLCLYYRTMPNALHLADPLGTVYSGNPTAETNAPAAPDDLFITTRLAAPATLEVTTGSGPAQFFDVAAGIVHTQLPFQPGPQSAQVMRGGKVVLTAVGEPVVTTITPPAYNFTYAQAVASAPYVPAASFSPLNPNPLNPNPLNPSIGSALPNAATGQDVAEASTADAADTGAAAQPLAPGLDIAERSSADAAG